MNNQNENSQPISLKIQYIIGIISGFITAFAIYLSRVDLGFTNNFLIKIQEYFFIILFLIFYISTKRIEKQRAISLKHCTRGFMYAMIVAVIVFFIIAITKSNM